MPRKYQEWARFTVQWQIAVINNKKLAVTAWKNFLFLDRSGRIIRGNYAMVSVSALKKINLPQVTWRRAWALLDAVYRAESEHALVNVFLDRIERLIPHESAVYFPIDTARMAPSIHGYITKGIPNYGEEAQRYCAYYFDLDPLKDLNSRLPSNVPVRNSDAVSVTQLKNSEFYSDFLGPLRILNVLGFTIRSNDGFFGGIGLHRPPGRRDFSEKERAILALLAPQVANALSVLRERERLGAGGVGKPSIDLYTAMDRLSLSPRQKQIANLVIQGFGNREISERLSISEHTVKRHLQAIYAKAEVNSRARFMAALAAVKF